MTKENIIRLGTLMGLEYRPDTNFKDAFEKGRVVFDGCNGQRFLFEESWDDDTIYKLLGESLILLGRREMKLEIHNLLSINSD